MTNYLKILILPVLLIFAGCNGEENTTNTEAEIPAGWLQLDLEQPGMHYGLPMVINIPDESIAKGKSEIMEGPFGGTQILAGSDFNLEIMAAPLSMAEKKEEIERSPIFKITYITDEPDMIFYKSEIQDTEIAQYHFYLVKEIGKGTYGIENVKEEEYSETGIQRMIDAAKSLKLK
ncbi:MAG: hypothetical protein M3Q58_14735 [Bacteroidota bacterium]|nr:hypothetical protein [Bacteroidota bacterium]